MTQDNTNADECLTGQLAAIVIAVAITLTPEERARLKQITEMPEGIPNEMSPALFAGFKDMVSRIVDFDPDFRLPIY